MTKNLTIGLNQPIITMTLQRIVLCLLFILSVHSIPVIHCSVSDVLEQEVNEMYSNDIEEVDCSDREVILQH
jgi:hypothetical protein